MIDEALMSSLGDGEEGDVLAMEGNKTELVRMESDATEERARRHQADCMIMQFAEIYKKEQAILRTPVSFAGFPVPFPCERDDPAANLPIAPPLASHPTSHPFDERAVRVISTESAPGVAPFASPSVSPILHAPSHARLGFDDDFLVVEDISPETARALREQEENKSVTQSVKEAISSAA